MDTQLNADEARAEAYEPIQKILEEATVNDWTPDEDERLRGIGLARVDLVSTPPDETAGMVEVEVEVR